MGETRYADCGCMPASDSPIFFDSARLVQDGRAIDAPGHKTRDLDPEHTDYDAEITDSAGTHGDSGLGSGEKFKHFIFEPVYTSSKAFQAGRATIKLTVTHSDGRSECYTQDIEVQPLPPAKKKAPRVQGVGIQ
jgi:hypothetical protein